MILEVLYEDNHCLAVNKPAGMPSQADESGAETLVDHAGRYLKERCGKPGNVYIGLVHRLDRPTSGVVLLARTSKAAGRLSSQFREGAVEKVYWAIVEGTPTVDEGTWSDRLEKDRRSNVSRVVRRGEGGGKEASVAFCVRERWTGGAWLELRPLTGRSHQLRVQLASRGLPIAGDTRYGAKSIVRALDGGRRVALHARSLRFIHPTRGEAIEVRASVPADWPGPTPPRPESPCATSKPAAGSGP